MITDILYRCPACGASPWLDGQTCKSCSVAFGRYSHTKVIIGDQELSVSDCYDRVLAHRPQLHKGGIVLESSRVRLSEEILLPQRYRGFAGLNAACYGRKPLDTGSLRLTADTLLFCGGRMSLDIALRDIVSLTIESNTVILIRRGGLPLFFDFPQDSGKQWEDSLRYQLSGISPDEILEYYPRIRTRNSFPDYTRSKKPAPRYVVPVHPQRRTQTSMVFAVFKAFMRVFIKVGIPHHIEGLEHIPEHGAAVVLPNHGSVVDPALLAMFTRRNIWFMGKNSEFRGGLISELAWRSRAFPVRRYQVDVAAVRNAIRIVQQGHILGIFPEGERSWDGRLLPFKLGTLRLVLGLGVPVIPVGISGSYALLPRWSNRLKRAPVCVRIGAPLSLGQIPFSSQTRQDIETAGREIRAAISSLMEVNT